jgi:hypothetical protein
MAHVAGEWTFLARLAFDDARLRSLENARPVLDRAGPSLVVPGRPHVHGPNHPWRRVRPESKLGVRLR